MTDQDDSQPDERSADAGAELSGSLGEEVLRLVSGAQDWIRQNFELADDRAADGHNPTVCGWCPLCQFVAVLRGDRPEVSEKVTQAGVAVVSAVKALLDATNSEAPAQRSAGRHADSADRVQKIDLGDAGGVDDRE